MASTSSALFLACWVVALDHVLATSVKRCGGPFVPPEKIVDISYSFNNRTIFWEDDVKFRLNVTRTGSTTEDWYQADHFLLPMRGGTYMDAPIHFAPGKWSASQIPLERQLFLPIVLVDVERQACDQAAYQLSVDDLEHWEEQHGRIPNGALVVARTGRSKLWPNREAYLGIDEHGSRHFPTFSTEAAQFLVERRNIYGVGLDSPSVDLSKASSTHRTLAAHNVYKLKNLADLSRVPAYGAKAIVLPIKVCRASGAPARVVAILP
ncbi:isatin hydrolase-like [Amblyomma americanum]